MTTQEARAARDAGIKQAAEHAEEVHTGWTDEALEAIRLYATCMRARNHTFTAEQMRNSIIGQCVPVPPHKRAWGAAFKRAAAEGLIVKVGTAQSVAPHCHLSYVSEWRAA